MSSYRFSKFKPFFLLLAYYFVYVYHIPCKSIATVMTFKDNAISVSKLEGRKIKRDIDYGLEKELKYVLIWTNRNLLKAFWEDGQHIFIRNKCIHNNCYVTGNRSFFPDITKFDVILFGGPDVSNYSYNEYNIPKLRAPHQKYVFANIESSAYYPVCWEGYDGFFNWTWTFKLNSDVRWGYLVIRNRYDNKIGPRKNMHWTKYEKMLPVPKNLENILRNKTKTAAWIVSNCHTLSRREDYVRDLQKALRSKYRRTVDVFGECGSLTCSDSICNEKLRNDYHFYLSFENSFSEDYVTEKLVRPLQNYAIPIVYGGANYSRFLPEKSYINAVDLSPEELADKMHALVTNFSDYLEYFRWTNHYYYQHKNENRKTDDYCSFCKLINNVKKYNKKKVYKHFRSWWNKPSKC